MSALPAKRPCPSCPYRRDVPSGVWSAEEYERLPGYDLVTGEQPRGAFFCHLQTGRLCAGWVGCHDMNESLGLRLIASMGMLGPEEWDAVLDYETDVPLFASGAEAAAHGLRELEHPGPRAQRAITKISERRQELTDQPPHIDDLPKHGDVIGDPNPGHTVEPIWAAVVVYADGSEGLASAYTFAEDGRTPLGRVTLVTSDPKLLALMKPMVTQLQPPEGGRIEWRTYKRSTEAVP